MNKKIHHATLALYCGSITNLVLAANAQHQIEQLRTGFDFDPVLSGLGSSNLLIFPAAILFATYFVARELRVKSKWSWAAALSLLLLNASGVSILFSIFGAFNLLDREIREHFFKAMEIDLG